MSVFEDRCVICDKSTEDMIRVDYKESGRAFKVTYMCPYCLNIRTYTIYVW